MNGEEKKKASEIANGVILNLVCHRFCQGDLEKLKGDKKTCYLCLYLGMMIPQADEGSMDEILKSQSLTGLSDSDLQEAIAEEVEAFDHDFLESFTDCREVVEMVLSSYHGF